MGEMMMYFLNNMETTDKRIKALATFAKKQRNANKNVRQFMFATTIYLVADSIYKKNQDKRIRNLEKEIEALKEEKGE